jgi:hypothetical protein
MIQCAESENMCCVAQETLIMSMLTTLTVISVTPKLSCCSAPIKLSFDELVASPARSSLSLKDGIHVRNDV